MRIAIGTNLLTNVDSEVYANHFETAFHFGTVAAQRGWQLFHAPPHRMSIDRMRNQFAAEALRAECDYIVFIDDDMLLKLNTIESLIDADKDIIMAHTYVRGNPFPPMSYILAPDSTETRIKLDNFTAIDSLPVETTIVDCDAVGFACVAIKMQLLKELKPPYFVTGLNHTEDIYFCIRVRAEIKRPVSIAVHRGVPTSHRVDSMFVGAHNVQSFRDMYGPQTPEGVDRGEAYYKMVEAL